MLAIGPDRKLYIKYPNNPDLLSPEAILAFLEYAIWHAFETGAYSTLDKNGASLEEFSNMSKHVNSKIGEQKREAMGKLDQLKKQNV